MPNFGTITRLLNSAEEQDPAAANELYRLVHEDLQRIARRRKQVVGLGAEVGASTTGLVDDAFCRLVGGDATTWRPGDRQKFFSYMSRKIHGDLIDLLRRDRADKRGGGRPSEALGDDPAGPDPAAQLSLLVDLGAALDRMDGFDPTAAAVVRYRHFLGCTFEEAADLLSVSKTEAVRTHQRALLWLRRELQGYDGDA